PDASFDEEAPARYGWHLDSGIPDTVDRVMRDRPDTTFYHFGKTVTSLSAGDPLGGPETFTTHLMFKPDIYGSWVPMSKVDWSWEIALTQVNGTWAARIPPATPASVTNLQGNTGMTWPEWTGLVVTAAEEAALSMPVGG
ncbi:MAG TPA: hypothetical protein VF590_04690, partial [Isosphaeraceae bacterium]